ncbi:MAG: aspartate kinase [Oscillospiraceae bacterium]|jgi:aspartate kinase|nr:aspartate kinase [Oscillospiraceae bacterium]
MATQVITTPGVSIVTFNNVAISHQNTFICEVFENSAEAGINIDMISQAPAASEKISFGFTFSDEDMPKLISIINRISRNLTPMINVGNIKVTIKSDEMVGNTGFASRVMTVLRDMDCLPLLVTTGLDEISLLVYESESTDLEKKLKEVFN